MFTLIYLHVWDSIYLYELRISGGILHINIHFSKLNVHYLGLYAYVYVRQINIIRKLYNLHVWICGHNYVFVQICR